MAPSKRRKTKANKPATKQPRRSKARGTTLEGIVDMPLDILQEIFAYLGPDDLLYLSRTSKALRTFLMNRASAFLWRMAFKNVDGLPERPEFLNEPAYANVLYSKHCHNCLKVCTESIVWELSARFCKKCAASEFISQGSVRRPPSGIREWRSVLISVKEWHFYKPQLSEVMETWAQLSRDSDAQEQFLKAQRQKIQDIKKHANGFRNWEARILQARLDEERRILDQRLYDIISRLRQDGWGDELDKISEMRFQPLANHRHFKKTHELTDREWGRIKWGLVGELMLIRDKRLARERAAAFKARFTILASITSGLQATRRTREAEFRPQFIDLAVMPEVQDIMSASDGDEIDAEGEKAFRAAFPTLVERWKADADQALRSILEPAIKPRRGTDVFKLAIAYFECDACGHLMPYPDVLAHSCCRASKAKMPAWTEYHTLVCGTAHRRPWDTQHLHAPSENAMVLLRKVIKLCGQDPDRATRPIMDDSNVRICRKSVLGKRIVTWDRAIREEWTCRRKRGTHRGADPLSIATEADMINARVQNDDTDRQLMNVWCCSMCEQWNRVPYYYSICQHLQREHGVANPSISSGDMYIHPDSW